jgi:hypothetical protein
MPTEICAILRTLWAVLGVVPAKRCRFRRRFVPAGSAQFTVVLRYDCERMARVRKLAPGSKEKRGSRSLSDLRRKSWREAVMSEKSASATFFQKKSVHGIF